MENFSQNKDKYKDIDVDRQYLNDKNYQELLQKGFLLNNKFEIPKLIIKANQEENKMVVKLDQEHNHSTIDMLRINFSNPINGEIGHLSKRVCKHIMSLSRYNTCENYFATNPYPININLPELLEFFVRNLYVDPFCIQKIDDFFLIVFSLDANRSVYIVLKTELIQKGIKHEFEDTFYMSSAKYDIPESMKIYNKFEVKVLDHQYIVCNCLNKY